MEAFWADSECKWRVFVKDKKEDENVQEKLMQYRLVCCVGKFQAKNP